MKTCILGVGRSGTTAIYSLLQEIFIDCFGNHVDFVYEPFLWDHTQFNKKYEETIALFTRMDSISSEAIFNHCTLPLFIENPAKFKRNSFLNRIFENKAENILLKFIRANGRFRLLTEICPHCKFIFIIRNPLDVINSVITRFSLLGADFHKDDWNRFSLEVNSLYGKGTIDADTVNSRVEKEVLYWYYMNTFALESFRQADNKPLLICYEDYVHRGEYWVERICDFLGILNKDIYYEYSKKIAGTQTKKNNLLGPEIELLSGYLDKYRELLESAGIAGPDNVDHFDHVLQKYKEKTVKPSRKEIITGRTPNIMNAHIQFLEQRLDKKDDEITNFKKRLEQMETKLTAKEEEKEKHKKKIALIEIELNKKKEETTTFKTKVNTLEKDLIDKEKDLGSSKKQIRQLEKELKIKTEAIADLEQTVKRVNRELEEKGTEINDLEMENTHYKEKLALLEFNVESKPLTAFSYLRAGKGNRDQDDFEITIHSLDFDNHYLKIQGHLAASVMVYNLHQVLVVGRRGFELKHKLTPLPHEEKTPDPGKPRFHFTIESLSKIHPISDIAAGRLYFSIFAEGNRQILRVTPIKKIAQTANIQLLLSGVNTKFGISQIAFFNNYVFSVKGWCFSDEKIDRLNVFIDGRRAGKAPVNLSRQDVFNKFEECRDENCGFSFEKILKPRESFPLLLEFYSGNDPVLVVGKPYKPDAPVKTPVKTPVKNPIKNAAPALKFPYFWLKAKTRLVKRTLKQWTSGPGEILGLPNEKNDSRLYALKNIHKGKRAFLIGNGPSLQVQDLDQLQKEITFASNRIFLAFDQTRWRPTYYTVADHIVAQNNQETIGSLKLKKVFATSVWNYFKKDREATFVNPPTPEGEKYWDLVKGVRAGYSVINLDLKLAYWMGIREVYVIGVDFHFEDKSIRTGRFEKGNEVIISTGEQNHFHPDYRKAGETWTIPRLDRQEEEFIKARQMFEAAGGKIFNASRRTKLEAWEKVDFDHVLSEQKNPGNTPHQNPPVK